MIFLKIILYCFIYLFIGTCVTVITSAICNILRPSKSIPSRVFIALCLDEICGDGDLDHSEKCFLDMICIIFWPIYIIPYFLFFVIFVISSMVVISKKIISLIIAIPVVIYELINKGNH